MPLIVPPLRHRLPHPPLLLLTIVISAAIRQRSASAATMSSPRPARPLTPAELSLCAATRSIIPPLTAQLHKGQAGRIGVVGGSAEYSGAPYFAAAAALRTGMDLVHVFCAPAAAPIIKAYSPDLIVHGCLDPVAAEADPLAPVRAIEPWLHRLDVLLIGPGLGRDAAIMASVAELIGLCDGMKLPMVIDADGLWLLAQQPQLVNNWTGLQCILTPNGAEMPRLLGWDAVMNDQQQMTQDEGVIVARLDKRFGSEVTVLEKASPIDRIWLPAVGVRPCLPGGALRRCGGQGDVLAGAVAAFFVWARRAHANSPGNQAAEAACRAASLLTRRCSEVAFERLGRGMLASDVLAVVPEVFAELFEPKAEPSGVQ